MKPPATSRFTRPGLLLLNFLGLSMLYAQLPAIPEPPLMLLGTVTDASTNQPVTITSIVWQVTDGTANKTFSAASLPATRVVSDSGQSLSVAVLPVHHALRANTKSCQLRHE